MTILIVEDDLLIAEMLKEMLQDLNYAVCQIKSTYEEVVFFLNNNNHPDLIFLDINLEQNKSGIDIGIELNKNYKIPFVYLTSYADPKTIKNAAQTVPEAYLTKPFSQAKLLTTLEIVRYKIEKNNCTIIKDGYKKIKLKNADVLYIKTDGNYIEINTKEKRYTIRHSLENFIKEFNDKHFARTHRSYAVNLRLVQKIKNQLIYINEIEIPLSRKYKGNILDLFNDLD